MKKFYGKKGSSLEETPMLMKLGRRHTMMGMVDEEESEDVSSRRASRASSVSGFEQFGDPTRRSESGDRAVEKGLSEDIQSIFSAASTVVITENELSSSRLYTNRKAKALSEEKTPEIKRKAINTEDLKPTTLENPRIQTVPVPTAPHPEKCSSCCCYLSIVVIICLASLGIIAAIGGVIYMELFATYLDKGVRASTEVYDNATLENNVTSISHSAEKVERGKTDLELLPAKEMDIPFDGTRNPGDLDSDAFIKSRLGEFFEGDEDNETSRVEENPTSSVREMEYEILTTPDQANHVSKKRTSSVFGDYKEVFSTIYSVQTENANISNEHELSTHASFDDQPDSNTLWNSEATRKETFGDNHLNPGTLEIKSVASDVLNFESTAPPVTRRSVQEKDKNETSNDEDGGSVDISESKLHLRNGISGESEDQFGIRFEENVIADHSRNDSTVGDADKTADNQSRRLFDISESDEQVLLNRPVISAGAVPVEFLRHLGLMDRHEDMDRKFSISEVLKYLRSLDGNSTLPTSRRKSVSAAVGDVSEKKTQQDIGKEREQYLQNLRRKIFD